MSHRAGRGGGRGSHGGPGRGFGYHGGPGRGAGYHGGPGRGAGYHGGPVRGGGYHGGSRHPTAAGGSTSPYLSYGSGLNNAGGVGRQRNALGSYTTSHGASASGISAVGGPFPPGGLPSHGGRFIPRAHGYSAASHGNGGGTMQVASQPADDETAVSVIHPSLSRALLNRAKELKEKIAETEVMSKVFNAAGMCSNDKVGPVIKIDWQKRIDSMKMVDYIASFGIRFPEDALDRNKIDDDMVLAFWILSSCTKIQRRKEMKDVIWDCYAIRSNPYATAENREEAENILFMIHGWDKWPRNLSNYEVNAKLDEPLCQLRMAGTWGEGRRSAREVLHALCVKVSARVNNPFFNQNYR